MRVNARAWKNCAGLIPCLCEDDIKKSNLEYFIKRFNNSLALFDYAPRELKNYGLNINSKSTFG